MASAMGWRKPDNVAGSSAPAIMVGFFVATGGLLFGYDTGTINGILAMPAFRDQFSTGYVDDSKQPNLLPSQSSLIVAILSLGTIVGSLLAAPAADFYGRRSSLIASIGVFCFGVVFQILSSDIPTLLIGRFFAGIGVGSVSVLVPLYQSEMAPKWIRGTLVCAYQLFITLGLLAASIVNLLTCNMLSSAAYRIPMGLQLTWACVLSVGLLILPETPRYLIKRGLRDSAAISLSRLRRLDITHPALVEELAEIEANHAYELRLGPDTYKELIFGHPQLGKRTLTGCGLQMLQQLTGVNFIMYYSTTFFNGAGILNPFLIALVINVVNVLSTFPGLLVVESWGRRKLLIIGAVGMAISQLLIASFTVAAPGSLQTASNQISVIVAAIYIFFFAASWGPVVWVVTSEIYPLKVRAKSMSVSTATNWLFNFGIAYGTPYMVGQGPGNANLGTRIFFIWGTFCIFSIFFVWFFVYETSKISLEQIDELYERVPKAWHSKGFEPSWSFQEMRDHGFSDSGVNPPPTAITSHELRQTSTSGTDSAASGTTAVTAATATTTSSSSTRPAKTAATPASEADNRILSSMGNVDLSY